MKKKHIILTGLSLIAGYVLFLKTRPTIPEGAKPVQDFKPEKYLGKWYEIARLDYVFERNMNNTSAEYSLNKDKTIKVVNSGYNVKTKKYKTATGKAKFVGPETEGRLKVSFFEPFYSAYNVIAIDDNYTNALVAGKNLDYLWFLSRDKKMPDTIKEAYLQLARSIGYDTSKLIWVEHD